MSCCHCCYTVLPYISMYNVKNSGQCFAVEVGPENCRRFSQRSELYRLRSAVRGSVLVRDS